MEFVCKQILMIKLPSNDYEIRETNLSCFV